MTDAEINKAIAEACGNPDPYWWCCNCLSQKSNVQVTYEEKCTTCGTPVGWITTPNYCHDLNAMHEAEKVLNLNQNHDYRDKLIDVVADQTPITGELFCWWNVTAHQRAEAFLRTIGKWHE